MPSDHKRRKRQSEAPVLGRFDCAYCRRNVRGETHLRHEDPDRADQCMCVDCYSCGFEVNGVKWTSEEVRVIDTTATGRPLLVEDWLADQEVRLLEGILEYGFGNWRAVAEKMGGQKTEQNCEDHYEKFYLRSKTFPLPDLSGPPAPVAPPAAPSSADAGHGAPAAGGGSKPERRGASGLAFDAANPPAVDLVGYMPLRGEYDTEWEDEAEKHIAEIEFLPTDTPEAHEQKLSLLRAYNQILDERQRRRDFVQRYDVIERAAKHHSMDRRLTREERQFRVASRPYAQHTTVDEHEALMKTTLKELNLRKRADHLVACASAGIRSIAEANALWRQALAEDELFGGAKPTGPSSRSALGTGGGHHGGAGGGGGGLAGDLDAHGALVPASLPPPPPAGSKPPKKLADIRPFRKADLGAAAHGGGGGGTYGGGTYGGGTYGGGTYGGGGGGGAAAAAGAPIGPLYGGVPGSATGGIGGVGVGASIDALTPPHTVQPESLLSTDESKACVTLGVIPSQYVACKRLLVTAACLNTTAPGVLSEAAALHVLAKKLDKRRATAFWQHCVAQGWVRAPP